MDVNSNKKGGIEMKTNKVDSKDVKDIVTLEIGFIITSIISFIVAQVITVEAVSSVLIVFAVLLIVASIIFGTILSYYFWSIKDKEQ